MVMVVVVLTVIKAALLGMNAHSNYLASVQHFLSQNGRRRTGSQYYSMGMLIGNSMGMHGHATCTRVHDVDHAQGGMKEGARERTMVIVPKYTVYTITTRTTRLLLLLVLQYY
jgi:hypothetical protein